MAEVKGADGQIKACGSQLFNNCTVYVVPGSPLQDGEHVFKLLHLKTKYAHHATERVPPLTSQETVVPLGLLLSLLPPTAL